VAVADRNPYTESGWLRVSDRIRLRYAVNDAGTRGAILVAPGWTENTLKYRELTGDLAGRGYSVFVLDHRSQGESSRLTANTQVSHVDSFEDYVEDLSAFYERVVLPRAREEIVLLGHSLGGLIGAWFAARRPQGLKRLVLSAPLFEVHGGLLPERVMYWVASALTLLGRGNRYVPGHRDWDEETLIFENNVLTQSRERFLRWRTTLVSLPDTRVGGVSNNWLKTVIEATRAVVDLADDIRVPVLLLQAGHDGLVRPGRQERFCRQCRDCKLVRFSTARHELLMETDEIRDRVLGSILEFVQRP
jgi:lysophospholipase